jgi:phospholipid/cholesterol/gamma-HCH transport system permease protein
MTGEKLEENWELHVDDSQRPTVARLKGSLDRFTVPLIFNRLAPVLKTHQPLVLDMAGVLSIDSTGVALVADTMKKIGTGSTGCSLRSVNGEVARQLNLTGWDFENAGTTAGKKQEGYFESVGARLLDVHQNVLQFLFLSSEIVYQGCVAPFKGVAPRGKIFVEQIGRLGAGSAPIVWLVALLVGLTTAFQSANELRQFGANIYVADLVAISMMRELGPLMAAILVAGRSGAAITAEIGTMRVTEELDAMKLIGINPIQYLAVPRVYAVVITQAFLGVTSAVIGIVGGLIIAIYFLNLSVTAFMVEAIGSLTVNDLLHNLSKSIVFGVIIVVVGVFFGLKVKGGAEGVGRATTSSVVTSIFLIILADCAFSFI